MIMMEMISLVCMQMTTQVLVDQMIHIQTGTIHTYQQIHLLVKLDTKHGLLLQLRAALRLLMQKEIIQLVREVLVV